VGASPTPRTLARTHKCSRTLAHTGSIFSNGECSHCTPSGPRGLTLTHSTLKKRKSARSGAKAKEKAGLQLMRGLRFGLGRTLRCSPQPDPSLQPAVHSASGTPLLPTHSAPCQSQSHRGFLQAFLPLEREGGCKLPSSSSTEAAEQPVSWVLAHRAPALRHPGVCGAVEPGWGAASYLIFSRTLISLVILPVTNRES